MITRMETTIDMDTDRDMADDEARWDAILANAPQGDTGYRPARRQAAPQDLAPFRLLDMNDLDSLPAPEWLVDGVLPADTFAVLFGAPGSTKSFWALDAACSIAAGYNLHGSPVKQGKVVYAAGEGLRGMRWRVEAWRLAHPDADMAALAANLRILPRTVRLLDEEDANRLLLTVADYAPEGLALMVIDTWARAMTGGDENSSHDAGLAIEVCETVRGATGATVLVVHHSTKDGSSERGSGSLKGAADAQMRMTKDEHTGVVTLKCVKMKDAVEFEDRRFNLVEYGHSAVLAPNTSPAVFQGGQYRHPGSPERSVSRYNKDLPF